MRRKVRRRKLNWKRIFSVLLFFTCAVIVLIFLWKIPIKNIFIYENEVLSDQEIIELAKIQNYPSFLGTSVKEIKNNLKESIFVADVQISKKNFREIHIRITENTPLFYNKSKSKWVLLDGRESSEIHMGPVLLNYTPEDVYPDLIKRMRQINKDILNRISEIEYSPNDVDKNRFLLSMTDGNYVYLTLTKFNNINHYIEIIRKFENKKGILYLDAGEYFQIIEP